RPWPVAQPSPSQIPLVQSAGWLHGSPSAADTPALLAASMGGGGAVGFGREEPEHPDPPTSRAAGKKRNANVRILERRALACDGCGCRRLRFLHSLLRE